MIGALKKIKQLFKYAGNGISKLMNSNTMNKILNSASGLVSTVPIVGGLLSQGVDNFKGTGKELGNLLTNIGNGKNISDSLHNYYNKTEWLGNPLNSLTIPNEVIRTIRNNFYK